jgi:hypothetical protein
MSQDSQSSSVVPWVVIAIGLGMTALVYLSYAYSKGVQFTNERYESKFAEYAVYDEMRDRCLKLSDVTLIRECFSRTERTFREQERAEQDLNAQREMAYWAEGMLLSSIVGVLVAAVGVAYVALTLKEARATTVAALAAEAAKQELDLAFPPRLVVAAFAIWNGGSDEQDKPPNMVPGQAIEGRLWVRNHGRDIAAVHTAKCHAYWRRGPLPMTGPREFNAASESNFPLHEFTHEPMTDILPGHPAGYWHIATCVPADYDDACILYVRGNLRFKSKGGMEHAAYFCRRYCPKEKRFIPVGHMEVFY